MDNEERISSSAILTRRDVAHLLGLPLPKVRRWSLPTSTRPPLITQGRTGYGPNPPTVPLLGLSEAAAMKHLIEQYKASPQRLSRVMTLTKARDPLAFAREDFFTDGTDIFMPLADGLERVKDGQQAFREVLGKFLKRLNFSNGLMESFTVKNLSTAKVVIDPRFSSGRPIIEGDGTPIFAILDDLEAGFGRESVAEDFELDPAVVADVWRARRELAPIA